MLKGVNAVNTSLRTYERVTLHMCMSHVAHMHELLHIWQCAHIHHLGFVTWLNPRTRPHAQGGQRRCTSSMWRTRTDRRYSRLHHHRSFFLWGGGISQQVFFFFFPQTSQGALEVCEDPEKIVHILEYTINRTFFSWNTKKGNDFEQIVDMLDCSCVFLFFFLFIFATML